MKNQRPPQTEEDDEKVKRIYFFDFFNCIITRCRWPYSPAKLLKTQWIMKNCSSKIEGLKCDFSVC